MRLGGRLQAAIEILGAVATQHRPVPLALKDWGVSHRFAGSSDRAAISSLVHDALRLRRSLAWRMGSETPRALILGAAAFTWQLGLEQLEQEMAADAHAPEALSAEERAALSGDRIDAAPDAVAADVPDWLWAEFERAFAEGARAEGAALAGRASLDLRVNTLKADRDKVLKALGKFAAAPTAISPLGLRIAVPDGPSRPPNLLAEAGFQKGWFEVQDEGSQLAALFAGAEPGMQVADICAGAGGKTLALAALMQNKGQVHAYDADRHQLKNIFERLKRAGTRNVQVLPAGEAGALQALQAKMDVVFADAPCSGSGVWRRRPDAKWRLSRQALEARIAEQAAILDLAAELVQPGGRILYVTCSVLPAENADQVSAFLSRHDGFEPAPLGFMAEAVASVRKQRGTAAQVGGMSADDSSLQLTPLKDSTDGFFIAALKRAA